MDKVKISKLRDLVMGWKRICSYIWFLGWSDDLVVNEIMNLMTQAEALVGFMTVLLVERCRRLRTSREDESRSVQFGSTTVRTQIVTVLNLEPKSPTLANRFEKQIFEKKCQTWTTLPDTESPPKYF